MELNRYQVLAARTISAKMSDTEIETHALFGMGAEIGELYSIYQKTYQGHEWSSEHAQKELGDLLWFIAEYASANGWTLSDIAQANIDKLKARYPDGFDPEKSLHRLDGDI